MKVVDFEGRETNWPPAGHIPRHNDSKPRSELHLRVRAILHKLYPTQPILEEVPLPGLGLFVDFYLPLRKVVIECQGEQHYRFIPHFHTDRRTFVASQNRDQRKVDWCRMNNIDIAILPYNESDDEFRTRIENAAD
jgi:hypothetical protein